MKDSRRSGFLVGFVLFLCAYFLYERCGHTALLSLLVADCFSMMVSIQHTCVSGCVIVSHAKCGLFLL